ncbi:hypothetical protein ACLB1R_06270 [Escherichia coli]
MNRNIQTIQHESGSNWSNVGHVSDDVNNTALSMPTGQGLD